ncbi:unnamed protein product [Notodromas monacha]|uniref:Uncharacterized protein n=1 Tax=Notodromas monacha TaxID=399045 RepID=A0A7R9GBW8_9CRUS|nr:unnamed protein product [Notodromas monacha]CAG0916968.1 unnamed protein product [Notodromas monacha]
MDAAILTQRILQFQRAYDCLLQQWSEFFEKLLLQLISINHIIVFPHYSRSNEVVDPSYFRDRVPSHTEQSLGKDHPGLGPKTKHHPIKRVRHRASTVTRKKLSQGVFLPPLAGAKRRLPRGETRPGSDEVGLGGGSAWASRVGTEDPSFLPSFLPHSLIALLLPFFLAAPRAQGDGRKGGSLNGRILPHQGWLVTSKASRIDSVPLGSPMGKALRCKNDRRRMKIKRKQFRISVLKKAASGTPRRSCERDHRRTPDAKPRCRSTSSERSRTEKQRRRQNQDGSEKPCEEKKEEKKCSSSTVDREKCPTASAEEKQNLESHLTSAMMSASIRSTQAGEKEPGSKSSMVTLLMVLAPERTRNTGIFASNSAIVCRHAPHGGTYWPSNSAETAMARNLRNPLQIAVPMAFLSAHTVMP